MIRARTIVASLAACGLAFSVAAEAKPKSGGQVRAASTVKGGKGAGSTARIVAPVVVMAGIATAIIVGSAEKKPASP